MRTITQQIVPTFDEAMPLHSGDENFLKELQAVLEKHGNINRFGLTLLHDHFTINEDEILLETNDHHDRTLEMQVVKRSDLTPDVKFTSWRIGGPNAVALTGCKEDKCKSPVTIEALTGCKEDKCKSPVTIEALTGCKEDKCKSPVTIEALTGCKEDKCKSPVTIEALTGCKEDKCKSAIISAKA
ncbi:hypothetical protein [Aquimarina muelleri]|uniref:Uncharacterized protein n=1 Tax=Aquimarina muelleri TaxID=279356 RepID=A0A918JWY4_9FLAO|nr:hypothetical protein [Aquimarina muelleri]MCX2763981.1 hypothetical protein [Aquimarina muelleri]GGX22082.1 hypothetical protein GCM10007384_24110 [Aquimarina muelleri]